MYMHGTESSAQVVRSYHGRVQVQARSKASLNAGGQAPR
jgi:hypothetical protein